MIVTMFSTRLQKRPHAPDSSKTISIDLSNKILYHRTKRKEELRKLQELMHTPFKKKPNQTHKTNPIKKQLIVDNTRISSYLAQKHLSGGI